VLGKLKLLTQASQQAVDEEVTIISDNVPPHTISIDNVCPYEVDDIFFFDLARKNCFYAFREVISGSRDVGLTSRRFMRD